MVFVLKMKQKGERPEALQTDCLVIDADNHKVKHTFAMPNRFQAFFLSHEGYLVGWEYHDEPIKLVIYRLEI